MKILRNAGQKVPEPRKLHQQQYVKGFVSGAVSTSVVVALVLVMIAVFLSSEDEENSIVLLAYILVPILMLMSALSALCACLSGAIVFRLGAYVVSGNYLSFGVVSGALFVPAMLLGQMQLELIRLDESSWWLTIFTIILSIAVLGTAFCLMLLVGRIVFEKIR